jgi:hypothetical protein
LDEHQKDKQTNLERNDPEDANLSQVSASHQAEINQYGEALEEKTKKIGRGFLSSLLYREGDDQDFEKIWLKRQKSAVLGASISIDVSFPTRRQGSLFGAVATNRRWCPFLVYKFTFPQGTYREEGGDSNLEE